MRRVCPAKGHGMPGLRREGGSVRSSPRRACLCLIWTMGQAHSPGLGKSTPAKLPAQRSNPIKHPAAQPSAASHPHHLALRSADKHGLGRSPKQPLVCLRIFGLAENSARSEPSSIIYYVKVFFSISKYLFSTFCSSVREKADSEIMQRAMIERRPNLIPALRKLKQIRQAGARKHTGNCD